MSKSGASNPTAEITKSGTAKESAKVIEINSHLLKDLLVVGKLQLKHLELLTEVKFEEINVEE